MVTQDLRKRLALLYTSKLFPRWSPKDGLLGILLLDGQCAANHISVYQKGFSILANFFPFLSNFDTRKVWGALLLSQVWNKKVNF